MIPKIIHQTWRSESTIPEPLKRCVSSIRKTYPNYDYKFYSDEDCRDYIKANYSESLNLYDALKPVERADLFRYAIMYEHGGIYFDVDCYTFKSLEHLIEPDDECIVGLDANIPLPMYCQWAFAAVSNHNILKEAVAMCFKNQKAAPGKPTIKKTGPHMWTEIINKHKDNKKIKLGPINWFACRGHNSLAKIHAGPRALPTVRPDSVSLMDFYKDDVYCIHLFYGSWLKPPGKTTMELHSYLKRIEHMHSKIKQ